MEIDVEEEVKVKVEAGAGAGYTRYSNIRKFELKKIE